MPCIANHYALHVLDGFEQEVDAAAETRYRRPMVPLTSRMPQRGDEKYLACFARHKRVTSTCTLRHQRSGGRTRVAGAAPPVETPATLTCAHEDHGWRGWATSSSPRRTPTDGAQAVHHIFSGPPHGARRGTRRISRWRAATMAMGRSTPRRIHADGEKYLHQGFASNRKQCVQQQQRRHDVIAESAR